MHGSALLASHRVRALLTEAQGLTAGGEHPLPWYPPVCVPLMDLPEGSKNAYDHLKSVSYAERSRIPLKYNDPSMRQVGACLEGVFFFFFFRCVVRVLVTVIWNLMFD